VTRAAAACAAAVLSIASLASCAARPTPAATPAAASVAGVWSYEVGVSPDAHALDVTATFPPGAGDMIEADPTQGAFVDALAVRDGASWRPLAKGADGDPWAAPCAHGCVVHYRFRLDDAARASGDVDDASTMHDAIEAPPSTWLLRPAAGGATYRFHVTTQGAARFATGVPPVPGSPDTYGARADDLASAPYSVFGKMRLRDLARKDATIVVATLDGKLRMNDADIDHWIDLSARAVESYYGRFPVRRLLLLVAPASWGHEQVEGRTLAGGGSTILLGVSPEMKPEDIPRDWVLTHEMTHLAMPTLPREAHWLEEGSATYVEPIARAQVGTIPASEVWKGLVEGLPNGQPEPGDEGLDNTHTWGRTYWGGALFCFLADVAIRERTSGRASLETALRGVLAFGSGERRASLEEVLRAGDAATGTNVLAELHARLGEKRATSETTDLPTLWKKLGVRDERGEVSFDDAAPLAGVRNAITR
jgi:hypothetical protein